MADKIKRLRDLIITNIDLVDKGANPDADIVLFKRDVSKAVWTTASINDLPDSAFAVISSGGTKDEGGKTVPRSLRHLPYKDASGKVDLPHLRNALARLPQTDISAEQKASAKSKLEAAAKQAGVGNYAKGGQINEIAEDIIKLLKKEGDDKMTLEEILAKLETEQQDVVNAALKAKEDAHTKSDDKLKVATEELEKIKKASEGDEEGEGKNKPEDVLKSATPEVKALFDNMQEKIEKLDVNATEAIKKANELETVAKRKEFIAKAEGYKGLAIKPEDFGEALMKISDGVDADTFKKLEDTLAVASKSVVESDLFKVQGSDGRGESGDIEIQIAKGAEELRKSDPKLTKEQAEAKFLEANPEIYEKYENEKGV